MKNIFTTYLSQQNPTVGKISYNFSLIRKSWEKAKALNADLLITTELVTSGYPPDDLLLRPSFIREIEKEVKKLIEFIGDQGPAIILGTPWLSDGMLYILGIFGTVLLMVNISCCYCCCGPLCANGTSSSRVFPYGLA